MVEEVLELLHHLFGVLDLVLELDRRLGDNVVRSENGRSCAHRQRQRVAGPGVDLELAAVGAAPDRVERRPQAPSVPQKTEVSPDAALVAPGRDRPWGWRGSRLEAAWLAYRFPILVYVGTRLALIAMALAESQVRHHA